LIDIETANLDFIRVERDVNKIVSGCIAILVGKSTDTTGHSVFVEYVERDTDGKPVNVYYTDVFRNRNGYIDTERDAKVIKVTFEKFSTSLSPTKLFDGYIIAIK